MMWNSGVSATLINAPGCTTDKISEYLGMGGKNVFVFCHQARQGRARNCALYSLTCTTSRPGFRSPSRAVLFRCVPESEVSERR